MHRTFWLVPLLLTALISSASADTTWVSGAVSGSWAVGGSPYVITDSAWVNSNTTLTVDAGVEILLPDFSSRFNLGGVLRLEGTAADSVILNLASPGARITGSRQHPGRLAQCTYVTFAGAGECYTFVDTVSFSHCRFQTGNRPWDWEARLVTARHSFLRNLTANFANIVLDSTTLNGEIFTWRSVTARSLCRAMAEEGDSIMQSTLDAFGSVDISNSDIESVNSDGFDSSRAVTVVNCRLGSLSVGSSSHVEVRNCVLNSFRMTNCQGIVHGNSISWRNPSDLDNPLPLQVVNNTFTYTGDCFACAPQYFLQGSSTNSGLVLANNIFYSTQPNLQVFSPVSGSFVTPPHHNLVWGMDDPWGEQHPSGPGNITADPLFDPDGNYTAVQFGSPAINGGDPAMLDPDGSVSDIGAWWWDHHQNHPPVISTPRHLSVRWGEILDLTITARDENRVQFTFPDALPVWMQEASHVDQVTSSRLFIGRVPFGAASFAVRVIATDNFGLTDTNTIQVDIYPRSSLTDTISGVLTADYSPYVAHHDVYVPAGDTLRVEPGVRIQLDSVTCGNALVVQGLLIAAGTTQDSIYFETWSNSAWSGIRLQGPAASAQLEYCRVAGAQPCMEGDNFRRWEVNHSTIADTRNTTYHGINFWSWSDSLIIRNCDVTIGGDSRLAVGRFRFENNRMDVPYLSFSGVNTDGDIRSCLFANDWGYLSFAGSHRVTIENNLFPYSPGLSLGDGAGTRIIRVLGNTFCHGGNYLGGSMHAGDSLVVVNNIFSGCLRAALEITISGDTSALSIRNNCFWQNQQNFDFDDFAWPSLGTLATTNLNGDSTDIYGNLFMDPVFADTVEYHLSAESPCIDAGLDVGLPFVGRAPDMGTWEYGMSAVPEHQAAIAEVPSLVVYPNPSNGWPSLQLAPEWFAQGPVTVRVYNVLGQNVWEQALPSATGGLPAAPAAYVSGLYVLKVSNSQRTMLQKFVVLK
ncbi:MAG TPA: T9SS type A sorting domain-containing protein [bacterium]|jgi:hypothetical protein